MLVKLTAVGQVIQHSTVAYAKNIRQHNPIFKHDNKVNLVFKHGNKVKLVFKHDNKVKLVFKHGNKVKLVFKHDNKLKLVYNIIQVYIQGYMWNKHPANT